MVKITNIIVILSVLLLNHIIAQENNTQSKERYFYSFDKKVPIYEVKEKMVIAFHPNRINEVKSLLSPNKIEEQSDGLIIIKVDTNQVETLRNNLLQIEGIRSVPFEKKTCFYLKKMYICI